ncbi:uncharacterized protein LOC121382639 [Gigantopelta aegis]|uniref:uncharacterized protein LOC121382639 n=1 Tax=Gigantopelta aegis TaxID=1735272 RepID=UPI001B8874A6|nr:uncharacterized protein LOC121382639 [Gigantopelta aegis]
MKAIFLAFLAVCAISRVASYSDSTEMITGEPPGISLTVSFFGFLKFGIGLSWNRISFKAQAGPVVVGGGIGYNSEGFGADLGVGLHSESSERKRQLNENTDSDRDEELKRREFATNEEKRRKEELATLKEKLSKMEAAHKKMKVVNQAYLKFLKDLNSSGKRIEDGNCLVIFGLVDIDNDVWNDVVFLLRKLHSRLKQSHLDFAFRFGVYEVRNQRPVIVQFSRTTVRQIVLDNTYKLTGSGVEIKEDVQINVFYD